MKCEVVVRCGQVLKIVFVEDLLPGACAIPEADLACGLLVLKQVREVRAKGGHPSATADVNHFALGGLHMEIPKGADGGDGVARLETEDITRSHTGSTVLA